MTTAAPHRHELRALTGMRGIAAWFVVLFHIRLSIDWLPAGLVALFAKGYLAVDFFFLLSGFVIWLSWSARLRSGGIAAVPGFLWRRLARIWPLHLVMLGATLALVLALAATGRHDAGHYPYAELPLHMLLLQTWGFTDRLTWNDPSWSISTEWAAYLLFPLVAFALDWRRVPSWVVVSAIGALLALLHVVMAGSPSLGTDIWTFGLRRCLIEFAVGGALCSLWQRWRDAPVIPALVALGCGIGAFVGFLEGEPETLCIPATFAAALLALALTSGSRGNPLDVPALHYLGEISYATYLSHFLLFVIVKLVLVDDVRDIPPVLIALYLLLVLGTSVALHHLVERPAQIWMNRLPARLRRTGSGAQASSSSS
ncbi:acyltransferase family protein [Sphingomonas sp. PAMC 26605]|uniref:acyltransferase family protein n=1 Tax=Sphingomonas sp. PAMC 26605 TaxID=1112214 RepID=UPI00031A37A3|nr:acyltransferase [Sphingomonas sp. PAMC 26605]